MRCRACGRISPGTLRVARCPRCGAKIPVGARLRERAVAIFGFTLAIGVGLGVTLLLMYGEHFASGDDPNAECRYEEEAGADRFGQPIYVSQYDEACLADQPEREIDKARARAFATSDTYVQRVALTAIAGQGSDQFPCPAERPIKGNVSLDSGEKIYHRPADTYYSRTNPEACFATTEAAEKAGFRPARR